MLATDRDLMWLERLNRHPVLRARMESLPGIVEDAAGDLEKADAAERGVENFVHAQPTDHADDGSWRIWAARDRSVRDSGR